MFARDTLAKGSRRQEEEEEGTGRKAEEKPEEDPISWWPWEEVFQGVGESDSSGQSGQSAVCRASKLAATPPSPTLSPAERQQQQQQQQQHQAGGDRINHEEEEEEEKAAGGGGVVEGPGVASPPATPIDHVDTAFLTCDLAGTGWVTAARLADHLCASLADLQPRWLVDSLKDTLCGSGEEEQLDLTTFRQLLLTWLHLHADHLLPQDSPDPLAPLDTLPQSTPHKGTSQDSFSFLGPLCLQEAQGEWMKEAGSVPEYPSLPPLPPPPSPPRQPASESARACFEYHLQEENRRSTLLPQVGAWGAPFHAPSYSSLDMSRPPSPISPPRSLTNGAPTLRPPAPIFPEDDCGPRSLEGGRNGHHPHHPNHSRLHHHNHHHHHNSFANFTYGSIEDEGGVTLPDPGELQQEVLELTHTNKRLTGENHDLTSHLTTAEETNATLRDQCRALQHALEGVQQQLSVARELEAEVEAARRQVEDGREEKESLVTRLAHLERDNTSLTSRLQLLTQQLSAAQEEAESHSLREEEAVRRHREEVARLSSQLSQWKAQAETQTLAAYRLRETLEDVQKLVEVLREEKRSLEEQLNHVKEELAAATASTESELSGLELGDDGMTFDTVTLEKAEGGKRSDAAAPSPVPLMPGAPFASPATATPTQAHPSPSVNTPLSIHSEIHTMGEDSGSLPFCEKSEGASSEERPSTSSSDAAGSPLASVLASMLRWWREWEERGIPLLRAMLNQDTIALHSHVATHYEELLRLERELQEIRRVTQPLSTTSEWAPLEEALQRGSVSSARDSALPSSQATTPTMPRRQVRTPGSFVSQLISKFESSSQSSSPVCSEASEVPGSGDHLSGLSRILQRARWERRPSFDDCARSESTNSEDGRSLEPHMKRTFEEKIRLQEDYLRGHSRDTVDRDMSAKGVRCDGHGPECGSEGGPVSSDHSDREGSVFLEYGLEGKETSDIHSLPLTAQGQEDAREEEEEEEEPEGRTVVMEEEPVPVSDPYMETSHLMKLMNEVAEQRGVISELRQQVSSGEEDKYKLVTTLERLHHLALLTSSDTFRWTEGVRREWLAVVAPRQGRLGEDGEGADSPTSALPAHHPLDEVPLTTSFSREEIEALISARRDPPPCDVLPQEEDQAMHVASPESLAAELERELTALRIHVLRSHALLHHYQSSSSQYGSRAEVSTPATQQIPHHVQGVEVGVECDLCGPTCVPRPCDSTATQTPASPLSTTPECEEDVGAPLTATTTASTSGTRLEAEEEEEEQQQQQQQQERERIGTKPQAKQKTIQWKEEYLEVEVEREEEEEEGRRVKDKEEEGSTVFDEGCPFQEEYDLLLSVGGGAKEPRRPHQQPPHQQPQQHPPGPRQVGFLGLPEHRELQQIEVIPPAHRTLRQLGVVEEDDKEAAAAAAASAAGVVEEGEIVLMASEHTLYSPKPAYDHLDHYRSGGAARGPGEEKLRRTGLSTVTPQISGGSEALDKGGDAPSSPLRPRPRQQPATQQEEEEKEKEKEEEGETNNTKKERVFPSLHDTYLRTAGLLRDDPAFTSHAPSPATRQEPHAPLPTKADDPPSLALEGARTGGGVGGWGRRQSSGGVEGEEGKKTPSAAGSPPSTPTPVDAAHLSTLPGKDSPGETNLPEETPVLAATPGKLPVISETTPAQTDLPEQGQLAPPGKASPPRTTKSLAKLILPSKRPKIISFSDLTNALGIHSPHRGKTRGSSSPHLPWNPSPLHGKLPEEGMDAELPVPEHLSCLYDVVKAVKNSNENLSAQEIENKFTQLSLAFKTDRLTLRQRLDLQQRHRDTAESNLENEFKHLRSSVLALHADCMDSELVDAVTQVRRHLDVLAASSNRLISTSEVWGAVQQEWRVSRALEVLFLHVDNVKRMYEQDHKELEELRRLLKECQIELPGQGQLANGPGGNNQTSTDSPVASRRLRALSLAICSTRAAQSSETRRVSVASSSSSKSSASGFAGSARSRNRRASLMPDLKPFRELAGFTAAALTASRESSSSSSSASGLSVPKESAEEGTASSATTSGRWSCSITEEVNESGEEDAGSTHDTTSSTTSNAAATTGNNNNNDDDDSTPGLPGLTPANIAALSHLHPDFQLEDDLLTDSEERDSDDSDHSEISQAPSEELKPSLPTFLDRFWARSRPPPWVLVAVEGLIGWAKGGQWPYSQQQTVQGARYAFTSLLLLVAALFLLVTLSSGDASIPQPRHPGWTTMNHLLHPFVTLRYLQTPPT
ncbi:uncharacterized protein LOC123501150 isoform X2 [Portunus trituberculatus]|uniref:uncharacterized protein LOC123501150 isoform X2 n=1 Tax=Portunus trituberculatus TaxID=210409 RepID=UPI001E1CBAC7|nr:uncharacterized protein LOC123501150 isoform X2 [Portunus trituberculatus]